MKVFLIIAGIIVISEVFDFILKAINSFLDKKELQSKVMSLKSQLDMANYIINQNNKVIDEMARNVEKFNKFTNTKSNISKDEIDAVRYTMKYAHPDNGGNAENFIRFKKCYEELMRKRGNKDGE